MREVRFQHWGEIDFAIAWQKQTDIFNQTIAQKRELRQNPNGELTVDYLVFCQHPHVYTLGKSGDRKNLLISEAELEKIGATYYEINRGGDITYHGPGQIVGYPILDLDYHMTDIHKYLRSLEEVIILTIAEYGLKGERSPGETGVWLDVGKPSARKICAMGIKASRWVTMHGFAFNVNADLSYFDRIVPCGITDKAVTSLDAEIGSNLDISIVEAQVRKHFEQVFNVSLT
jgi:lipoyl(octanoyl) transferase